MPMSYDEAYDKAWEDMEQEAEEVLSDAGDYDASSYNSEVELTITIEGITVSVTIDVSDWFGSTENFIEDGLGGIDAILGLDEFCEDYIRAYCEEHVEEAMDKYDWSDDDERSYSPRAKKTVAKPKAKKPVKKVVSKSKAKKAPAKPKTVKKTVKRRC